MGCLNTTSESRSAENLSPQDQQLLLRLNQMLNKSGDKISTEELGLIRSTFTSIFSLEESSKNKWLEAMSNGILTPLFLGMNEDIRYQSLDQFSPDLHKAAEIRLKDFEVFKKSKEELKEYILHIFFDLIVFFSLDIVKFQRFVFAICENYQDNPFHNFYHAFSVLQITFSVCERNNKFDAFITPLDRLVLFVSALGHDLNHPGLSNTFLVNSRHPLAVRYNDISVLENHHASCLIQILETEGCDFFSDFSLEDKNYLRRKIIPIILATDMANHNRTLENFRGIIRNYNKDSEEHREKFMDFVLHSADVGNPTLKFDLATVWSLKIIKEFNEQVYKEESLGLPVSEFMRIGNEITKVKENQIGFINGIIEPLWALLGELIENVSDFIEAIKTNKKSWEVLESLS